MKKLGKINKMKISKYLFGLFIIGIVFCVSFFRFGVFAQIRSLTSPPSEVRVTATSSCAFVIEWEQEDDTSPPFTHFDILRADDKDETNALIKEEAVERRGEGPGDYVFTDKHNETWKNWPGLEEARRPINPETKLFYWVRAGVRVGDDVNVTDFASSTPATTLPLPGIPDVPNVVSGEGRTGIIGLEWGLESESNTFREPYRGQFEIQRSSSASGAANSWSEFVTIASSSASRFGEEDYFYNDNDVSSNFSYKYRIRAKEVGGIGCDASDSAHFRQSNFSEEIEIPRPPSNLSAHYNSLNNEIEVRWSNPSENETHFILERKIGEESSYEAHKIISKNQNYYDDDVGDEIGRFFYRVRACKDDFCSFYSNSDSVFPGIPAPENPKAGIVYVNPGESYANVNLSWGTAGYNQAGSRLYIERAELSEEGGFEEIASLVPGGERGYTLLSFQDERVEINKKYKYGFSFGLGTERSEMSLSNEIDLNIALLMEGQAWSGYESGEGEVKGLGWVSMSSDSITDADEPHSSEVKYSVQIDRDGVVSGVAWASFDKGRGWGWISFNEADLEGCPMGPCQARLDANNRFVGWARIMSPFFSGGGLGWIRLSSPVGIGGTGADESIFSRIARAFSTSVPEVLRANFAGALRNFIKVVRAQSLQYGIYYVEEEGLVRGTAWSDMAGWIAFSMPECEGKCLVSAHQTLERELESPVVRDVRFNEGKISAFEPNRTGNIWCAALPYYRVEFRYHDPDDERGSGPEEAKIGFFQEGSPDSILWEVVNREDEAFDCASAPLNYFAGETRGSSFICRFLFADPLGYNRNRGYYEEGDELGDEFVLRTNVSYRARVRVSTIDGETGEVHEPEDDSLNFQTTPSYYYPLVGFEWRPRIGRVGRPMTFYGEEGEGIENFTKIRGGVGVVKWSWSFGGNAEPPTDLNSPISEEIIFDENATAEDQVKLEILDGEHNFCSYTQEGIIGGSAEKIIIRREFRER